MGAMHQMMMRLDVQLPNHPPVEDDDPRTERMTNMMCKHPLVKHILVNPVPQSGSKVCNRLIPGGYCVVIVNLTLEIPH